MVAGASAQTAGQTMEAMDADSQGFDDKLGKALELTGKAVVQYAAGNVSNWQDKLRLAGQTLLDLSNDPDLAQQT